MTEYDDAWSFSALAPAMTARVTPLFHSFIFVLRFPALALLIIIVLPCISNLHELSFPPYFLSSSGPLTNPSRTRIVPTPTTPPPLPDESTQSTFTVRRDGAERLWTASTASLGELEYSYRHVAAEELDGRQ